MAYCVYVSFVWNKGADLTRRQKLNDAECPFFRDESVFQRDKGGRG